MNNPNPAMMLFLQSLGIPGTMIPAFDPYSEEETTPSATNVAGASATALATWGALFGPAGALCPDTPNANITKAECIAGSGLQALGWIWSSSQAVIEYPRTFTAGGSMDYQIPNIDTVLRLEVAYDFNRTINNTKKLDGIDHSDVVLAAIGLDRSFFIPFLNKEPHGVRVVPDVHGAHHRLRRQPEHGHDHVRVERHLDVLHRELLAPATRSC